MENESIIENLKHTLKTKEQDLTRMQSELKDKNNTTQSILSKEKENNEFKTTLMQQSIHELRSEVEKKTREFEELL